MTAFPTIFRLPEEPESAPLPIRYGPPPLGGLLIFRHLVVTQPDPDQPAPQAIHHGAGPIDYCPRLASARGLYRIFNAAAYRFYWSTGTPPVAGTGWQATNSTLAFTTPGTLADGTWFVSVSYFDGVLDSGFLTLGSGGETYLTVQISGGAAVPAGPSQPSSATLNVLAGGVIQVTAYYNAVPDAASRATTWALGYTTDGSTPPDGAPTVTRPMSKGPFQILSYNLPAQADGTVVKVQLQTFNGTAYSTPLTVLSATASTTGPSAPLGLQSWPGALPEGE